MKRVLLLTGVLLLVANADAAASPSASTRLRKLSLTLKGINPTAREYAALKKISTPSREAVFFAAKTREYLQSAQHVGKMIDRLDELFRLKLSEAPPEARLRDPLEYSQGIPATTPGVETYNSLDLLFEMIVRKNLTWDALLTAKDYWIPERPDRRFSLSGSDRDFFAELADLPPPEEAKADAIGTTPWTFPADDLRVAGALTTARFFDRYSTTNLNKSRGRAAAIFRIFLCDEMKPVVLAKKEDDDELFDLVFPKEKASAPGGPAPRSSQTDAKRHGSEASCLGCHYKLDPMGQAFVDTTTVLSEVPSPGALVFRRDDGSRVEIPGRGLGEIAEAITRQPEYARCQVRHFWKWFVDGSGALSPEREKEIVDRFDRLGRRTDDFIAYLVNEPEFYVDTSAPGPTVAGLRPWLARCTSCHAGSPELRIPSFTEVPIGGAKNHAKWLVRIAEQLDLENAGADATMPPAGSTWSPQPEELAALRAWIADGARDDRGEKTIDPATVTAILGRLTTTPTPKRPGGASFHDGAKKYLGGHDLLRVLRQTFPKTIESAPEECRRLQPQTRSVLGLANPVNGERPYASPSPAFLRWYARCVTKLANSEVLKAMGEPDGLLPFLGQAAVDSVRGISEGRVVRDPVRVLWGQLPANTRGQILDHLIARFLGPRSESYVVELRDQLTDGIDKMGSGTCALAALERAVVLVALHDDFLTY